MWDCLRQRDRPYPPGCEHRASGGFMFRYILRGGSCPLECKAGSILSCMD